MADALAKIFEDYSQQEVEQLTSLVLGSSVDDLSRVPQRPERPAAALPAAAAASGRDALPPLRPTPSSPSLHTAAMASAFYSQPQQRSWPLAGAAQQHAARPPPIRQASGPGPGPAGGGVTSWLSGWTKLAEEQGCAVSALEVEGSYTQQLLQRASGGLGSQHLSRGCSCTMPSPTCCADARMLASVAVGPSQSHQQLLSQRHLGLSAFQEQQAPSAARAAASVLSDGSSNTNSSGSSCTVGRGSNELKQRLNPFAYAQGPAGGTGTHARRPPARLSPLRQQQQEQAQQRVPPRGYTSMDVGRPAATAPAQGRTSIDCWADGSSMASAHQQGGSRGAKRKSEDCFAPPARHQATVGGWQTALSSAFYTPSAPLPPVQSATLPGPEAERGSSESGHMQMQFGGAPAPAGGAISRHPAQSLDPSHRSPFALAQPPAPLAAPAAAPYGQGTPSVSVARPETPGVFSLADWEEMLPTELLTGPAGAGMDPQLAAALAMRAGGGLPSRSC